MSYLAYQAEYKNIAATVVDWRIEIHDTEEDEGQTINFETDRSPSIKFEGLPQDLKSGVYPTSFSVMMMITASPYAKGATTFGPTESFIDTIAESQEGRFILKIFRDDEHVFTGPILYDQCQYEDRPYPYGFTIEAADGMYKWRNIEYVSEVGRIRHKTLRRESVNQSEYSEDFVTTDMNGDTLDGTEWIAIEHESIVNATPRPQGGYNYSSWRATTYARYESYQYESPDGTGWVDQGGSTWAKELTYSNEVIVEEPDQYYHLTRDIDDTPFRAIGEFIRRGMRELPTVDQYGEDPMYDITCNWYETSMPNTWDYDPLQRIRVSEEKIATGTWWDLMEEIARHFYLRIYYANGRYHFEQISERSEEEFVRHVYDSEGTFIESETVNLDLDYTALSFKTNSGGSTKFLAPLKNVLVSQKLSDPNLLVDYEWHSNTFHPNQGTGQRYLGRIKKSESDTRLLIQLNAYFESIFDVETWFGLDDTFQQLSTANRQYLYFTVRIRNVQNDTWYHLKPTSENNATYNDSTWEVDPVGARFTKYKKLGFISGVWQPQVGSYNYRTLTEQLAGNIGDSFDVYISVAFGVHWEFPAFAEFWTEHNPTKYFQKRWSEGNSMTTVNEDEEAVNSDANRAHDVTVHPSNSITIEIDAKFGDYGSKSEYIEILNANDGWERSNAWKRNGTEGPVDGDEFLTLLAKEIASLRQVPRRIYSGGFPTTIPTTENRIQKGGLFFIPLTVTIDTDIDNFSGEFLNIARTTPPDGVVIGTPYVGSPLPPLVGDDGSGQNDPEPLYFETDAAINEDDNLTQIAIINTQGQHVDSGETVKIINPQTGEEESVTLTAPIEAGDTIMEFAAHVFLYDFPDGSAIVLQTESGLPHLPPNEYLYTSFSYSGADHYAATYMFPNPEGNTPASIDRRIDIWRNGNKMSYRSSPQGPNEYGINYAAKKFTFPYPLSNEILQIKAR